MGDDVLLVISKKLSYVLKTIPPVAIVVRTTVDLPETETAASHVLFFFFFRLFLLGCVNCG